MSLLCPVCRVPLSKITLGARDFHRCETHGLWIPVSFFSQFKRARSIISELYLARRKIKITTEKQIKCPQCYRTMSPTEFPRVQNLVVDQCLYCNGTWFDTGELNSIPHKAELESAFAYAPLQTTERNRPEEKLRANFGSPSYDYTANNPLTLLGLPVEEDLSRTKGTAVMTFLLVLICLPLTAKGLKDAGFLQRGAFFPLDPFRNGGRSFFISMFLHGGWWHFFSNMYFLLICGDNIEEVEGPLFLFGLFIASASFGHLLYSWSGGQIPSVGASGGICGLMAYYGMAFPKNRFHFRIFPTRFSFANPIHFSLSAPACLVIFIFLQLFNYLFVNKGLSVSNVNFLAHLGGIFAGLMAFMLFAKRERQPS